MFENIVINLLSRYLGEYVDGLNAKNLNISLTQGNVLLTNLVKLRITIRSLKLIK